MARVRPSAVARAVLWAVAALCLAWALMRAFGLERGFPLQAAIAWTPYVIPLALVAAALAGLAREWWASAAAGIASVLMLAAVVPRVVGGGHDPAGATGPELRVMGANLKLGEVQAPDLLELVRAAEVDVLCLQELTPDRAAELRAGELGRLLPHRLERAAGSSQGSAILSRYPLRPLTGAEPAGYPFAMPRAAVRVPAAASVEVISVHPVPPTDPDAVEEWEAGLEALPDAGEGTPLRLLVGDFNATLDHRELREVAASGYVDAADATGKGLVATWPERLARPGVAIDHVLADERIAVSSFDVHELPGSDHRAVSATLRLPPR